jgi:branched-chain amino acid transport system permease protein
VDQLVLFTLLGLGTGALIAGIGLGVVLTYRGSGVINVATGAEAMAAGYAFYSLRTVTGTPLALLGTLAFTIALGVAIELLAFRPLRTASPLARLVASLGVLLTLQAGATLIYGTGARPAPSVLPHDVVRVTNVAIPADRFWLTGIVVLITLGLTLAYRYTRFGLATRAASESQESAILAGLGARELSLVNTVLGALIAGGIGVLASSIVQLDATTLPLQVVPALGAVLFARFTSFAITCVAGVLIGVLQSLLYYASTQSWFPTDNGAALPGSVRC